MYKIVKLFIVRKFSTKLVTTKNVVAGKTNWNFMSEYNSVYRKYYLWKMTVDTGGIRLACSESVEVERWTLKGLTRNQEWLFYFCMCSSIETNTSDWIPIFRYSDRYRTKKNYRNIRLTKLSDLNYRTYSTGPPIVRQLSDWLKSNKKLTLF